MPNKHGSRPPQGASAPKMCPTSIDTEEFSEPTEPRKEACLCGQSAAELLWNQKSFAELTGIDELTLNRQVVGSIPTASTISTQKIKELQTATSRLFSELLSLKRPHLPSLSVQSPYNFPYTFFTALYRWCPRVSLYYPVFGFPCITPSSGFPVLSRLEILFRGRERWQKTQSKSCVKR